MLWRACLLLAVSIASTLAFPQSVRSRLFIDHSIYSDEPTPRFLGTISTSTFGNSILNTSGSYGSSFSSTSIRNPNSTYGSTFSTYSAYNPSALRPPLIVNSQNIIVGFVTKNSSKVSGIDPDFLIGGLTALNNWNFYSDLFYRDLYSYDGTFLGVTTPDKQSALSIINEFGSYGSAFSSTSIFNRFGAYGSEFSSQSAYNSFASTPPALFAPQQLGGQFAAYVTKNSFRTPAADPDVLRAALLLAPDMPYIIAGSHLLEGFSTTQGIASAARTISISAGNLIAPLTVSLLPLEKYWEISTNGSTFGSEFQLQAVNGLVNATIYLRLSASAPVTTSEPGGITFSGFTVSTAYAGESVYMSGTVTPSTTPTPTPTPTPAPEPEGGSFTVRAPGGVRFISGINNEVGVSLAAGETSWKTLSDSNLKTDITAIDHRAILDQLVALPVGSWQYKHDATRRYLGPMAQDFRGAFGLGYDDRHISTLDMDGVALAALKGLIKELEGRKNRSAAQARRLAELEEELRGLREQLVGDL